jgi:hypothetical protein
VTLTLYKANFQENWWRKTSGAPICMHVGNWINHYPSVCLLDSSFTWKNLNMKTHKNVYHSARGHVYEHLPPFPLRPRTFAAYPWNSLLYLNIYSGGGGTFNYIHMSKNTFFTMRQMFQIPYDNKYFTLQDEIYLQMSVWTNTINIPFLCIWWWMIYCISSVWYIIYLEQYSYFAELAISWICNCQLNISVFMYQ